MPRRAARHDADNLAGSVEDLLSHVVVEPFGEQSAHHLERVEIELAAPLLTFARAV